jgi:NTP pyrophosphatase (non-canonical NTP hydrolase)
MTMNKFEKDILVGGILKGIKVCHDASREAGWYTDPLTGEALDRNVPEMLCLMHSEISEAMEGYRKNLMDDKIPSRSMIEVEIGDLIIRAFDLAGYLELDLAGALIEKLEYNQSRADHKLENRAKAGGKKF